MPTLDHKIVETLARVRAYFLCDLLPAEYSREDAAELHRVADALVAKGKIKLWKPAAGDDTVVFRPTDGVPDPGRIARLAGTSR
jgi:hypothetical protein